MSAQKDTQKNYSNYYSQQLKGFSELATSLKWYRATDQHNMECNKIFVHELYHVAITVNLISYVHMCCHQFICIGFW